MPSAEDPTYLTGVMPADSPTSGYSHDVDDLVSRIKENLRLSKSRRHHRPRPAPYKLPITSTTRDGCGLPACGYCNHDSATNTKSNSVYPGLLRNYNRDYYDDADEKGYTIEDLEDSYEEFQALLRRGALIREAVKRLGTNNSLDESDIFIEDQISKDDTSSEGFFKNRFTGKIFYQDDDENLPIKL